MGGMVATNDSDLAERVRAFQERCAAPAVWQTVRYLMKFITYHFLTHPRIHRFTRALYELGGRRHPLPRATAPEELRGGRKSQYEQALSNAQAALALRELQRLESNVRHRRRVAGEYARRLPESGYAVPATENGAGPAFVRYPVWVKDRPPALRAGMPRVLFGNWFTSVLEEATSPTVGGYEPGSCPRAEAAAEHLINLPTHPRIDQSDVDSIISVLADLRH
jgi:dTDP-4-amino-4,6-dideoxygalactose transaminase